MKILNALLLSDFILSPIIHNVKQSAHNQGRPILTTMNSFSSNSNSITLGPVSQTGKSHDYPEPLYGLDGMDHQNILTSSNYQISEPALSNSIQAYNLHQSSAGGCSSPPSNSFSHNQLRQSNSCGNVPRSLAVSSLAQNDGPPYQSASLTVQGQPKVASRSASHLQDLTGMQAEAVPFLSNIPSFVARQPVISLPPVEFQPQTWQPAQVGSQTQRWQLIQVGGLDEFYFYERN